MTAEYLVPNPTAMEELGEAFAKNSKPKDVFALVGPLGSGKTHWTKGFLKALLPKISVTSPTFSLVNEYREGEIQIHHFDFYRLKSANELLNLGWDDYVEDYAILICEWADMFPELMPENTRWLEFAYSNDDSRIVRQIQEPPTSSASYSLLTPIE